jgi:hypothetical protein
MPELLPFDSSHASGTFPVSTEVNVFGYEVSVAGEITLSSGIIADTNVSGTLFIPDYLGPPFDDVSATITASLSGYSLIYGEAYVTSQWGSIDVGFPGGPWTMEVVPLPSALPLFAGGLGTLGFVGWRRKRRKE